MKSLLSKIFTCFVVLSFSMVVRADSEAIGPTIRVSKTNFYFIDTDSDGILSNQYLTITNSGDETLYWMIDMTDKPDWLTVSPISGTLSNSENEAVTLSVGNTDWPEAYYSYPMVISSSNPDVEPTTVKISVDISSYYWSMNPGDGSPSNPYQIWTPEQMNAIGESSDQWGMHFKLMADIDMSAYTGTRYNIIGNSSNAFRGVFDGNGHIIGNLTIINNNSSVYGVGLFGICEGATIKNMGLQNVSISSVGYCTGGLVGWNHGDVENCYVTGSVAGSRYVGGLIGWNKPYNYFSDGDTLIKNCYTRCEVVSMNSSNDRYAGGLIGQNNSSDIFFCYAVGNVVDQALSTNYTVFIGGLIGYNVTGDIKFCRFDGNVDLSGTYPNSYTGGLVGRNGGTSYSDANCNKIFNCYSSGEIKGGNNVGGLVGYNNSKKLSGCGSSCTVRGANNIGGLVGYNRSSVIVSCSANGTVDGNEFIGGLIGYDDYGDLAKSYAECSAEGNQNVGGLAGYIYGTLINDCYATGSISGAVSNVGGGIGKGSSYTVIENCYAVGPVNGTAASKGGFIGSNDGTIVSCFWDTDTSGLTVGVGSGSSTGVLGQTTDAMQTLSTFTSANWDFNNDDGNPVIWGLSDSSYPKLFRQLFSGSSSYSGGDGSLDDPYQIATISDFHQLTNSPDDWSRDFILISNLDLNDTVFTTSPIAPDRDSLNYGFQGVAFSGTFDGNGHTISNLRIEAAETDYVGLFGRIAGGQITNLHVENAVILGHLNVGCIAGSNSYGIINNCQTTGSVSGTEYIGGLVGYNIRGTVTSSCGGCFVNGSSSVGGLAGENGCGTITDCMATAPVTISGLSFYSYGGGLVGCNSGNIDDSFSTAAVIADGNDISIGGIAGVNYSGEMTSVYSTGSVTSQSVCSNYTGGFVGYLLAGSVNYSYSTSVVTADGESGQVGGLIGDTGRGENSVVSCFWDIESSGLTYSAEGKAVNSQLMKTLSVFQNAGWANKGWVIEDGVDIPRLAWQGSSGSAIPPAEAFLAGKGTDAEPYLIYTAEEFALLSWHADILDKNLKLMNDLDLSGMPIFPIGDLGEFTGTFNGSNHILSNVTIHQPGSDYIGVFSKIGSRKSENVLSQPIKGRILNLKIINADIIGNDYVGGLAGANFDGVVYWCSCEGSIKATGWYVGGLTGYIQNCNHTIKSKILYSYANSTVEGTHNVGGLIGFNKNGEIGYCYTTGPVVGTDTSVGGLIGKDVTGSSYTRSCFWDTQTSGLENGVGEGSSVGITGKNTAEMMTSATFIDAGWDFVVEDGYGSYIYWRMCTDGVDYPRLTWEFAKNGDFACGDGVDLADLEALAISWLSVNKYPSLTFNVACDANGDNVIDLEDFSALSENWP